MPDLLVLAFGAGEGVDQVLHQEQGLAFQFEVVAFLQFFETLAEVGSDLLGEDLSAVLLQFQPVEDG